MVLTQKVQILLHLVLLLLAAVLVGQVRQAAALDPEVLEGLEVVQDTITPPADQLHLGRVIMVQVVH